MSVAIFSGPTLWNDPVVGTHDFHWYGPARNGDVYRVARRRPHAIGIIDGQFETVPSLWHKEILWALSQGIHVFGAGSLGALRAAELAPFGMRGVGAVYRDFAAGTLDGDDEVAVLHASSELAYRPLSTALVDIRATVAAAEAAAVISPDAARALIRIAKQTFFKDRTWPHLMARLNLAKFARWLPHNQVERKRADAHEMVHAILEHTRASPGRFEPAFSFQRTALWQTFTAEHSRGGIA